MYIIYIFATVLFPFTNAKLSKKLSDFIENLDGIEKWKEIEGVYKYLIYSIEEVVSKVKQREEANFQLCMYVVRQLLCKFGYESLLEFTVI